MTKTKKAPRTKISKGFDLFGRCLMHHPLVLPGWFANCSVCKHWVNVLEEQGLYGLTIEPYEKGKSHL